MTQARRAWYAHPGRRRRLRHPVISVGNLVSGGSGKTPVVAAIASLLLARGERPAILTRGYGRRDKTDGVLVVSDGTRVLEPPARSGDEPQLLAHTVPGVPVLVCADRYLAGSFAERMFAASVSVLDDGFQHVQLEREIDLLLVSRADLAERVLPSGHLREPLTAARFADALLVSGEGEDATDIARLCGHESAFRIVPHYGDLKPAVGGSNMFGGSKRTRSTCVSDVLAASVGRVLLDPPSRLLAVAGIARPERFFGALRELGWNITRELTFRDHHWYAPKDLETIERAARESGASAVVTTEKDAVRLPPRVGDLPLLVLPMTVAIEPTTVFESWLFERLVRARQAGAGG